MEKNKTRREMELDALSSYVARPMLDVCCGGQKARPWALGVDTILYGQPTGCGPMSKADIISSAEKLPFPGRAYNAVTILHGLSFVDNVRRTMDEAHRVLIAGGWFVSVVCPFERRFNSPLLVSRWSSNDWSNYFKAEWEGGRWSDFVGPQRILQTSALLFALRRRT